MIGGKKEKKKKASVSHLLTYSLPQHSIIKDCDIIRQKEEMPSKGVWTAWRSGPTLTHQHDIHIILVAL